MSRPAPKRRTLNWIHDLVFGDPPSKHRVVTKVAYRKHDTTICAFMPCASCTVKLHANKTR